MASPLTVARNNYHKNPKASAIYTPPGVARFLFDILQGDMRSESRRPVSSIRQLAAGSLTDPWSCQRPLHHGL